MTMNEELKPVSQVIRVAETRSTNSLVRELIQKGTLQEGSVVLADFQTAGRGQLGNVWESERGKNLTFSLALDPKGLPVNQQFLISQIAALSVKEALEAYTEGIAIKWPNDVYWHDRKICGMLIENDLCGHSILYSIIGIGINVNQGVFKGDAPNPVSLAQILGHEVDREEVLQRFVRCFTANRQLLLAGDRVRIREHYFAALYRREGFFPFADADGTFEASIHDIEPTGHLQLRLQDGSIRRYAFKEVTYIFKKGVQAKV